MPFRILRKTRNSHYELMCSFGCQRFLTTSSTSYAKQCRLSMVERPQQVFQQWIALKRLSGLPSIPLSINQTREDLSELPSREAGKQLKFLIVQQLNQQTDFQEKIHHYSIHCCRKSLSQQPESPGEDQWRKSVRTCKWWRSNNTVCLCLTI